MSNRRSARSPVQTMVSLLGAVVAFAAPAALLAASAGADQIGATQSQVETVRNQITADATRIHRLTAAFDQANLTATDGAQQLQADQANLAASRQRLAGSEQALRETALQSYTGGASGSVDDTPAVALDPAVSSAYISVAVGSISDSVDQYQLQQRQLDTAQATVAAQERANVQAVAAAASTRNAALVEAGNAEGRLSELQGQLDQLVAAQSLAAAAADRPAPASTQGGPVGGGLVAVVSAIVRVPAPSAATPVPAAPTTSTSTTAPPTTAPPTTSPPTTAPPTTPPVTTGGGAGGPWLQLRECESGDNYREDTGNGFFGAYQFSAATWTGMGYPGRPDQEPAAMQDQAAMRLQAASGWGQWPACSAALGLH